MVFRDVAKDGTTRLTGGLLTEGEPGRGIFSAVVRYQASASGTVTPSGTWLSAPPATTAGQYLWTRVVYTYTDATTTTTYSVARHGLTGSTGSTGPQGTRWGITSQWLFAGVTNVVVSFPDGGPPRVGDFIMSSHSLGLGDVATVVSVVDSTHANLHYEYNLRGPQGPATADSGWTDVTLYGSWTHFDSARHAQFRKVDKLVEFRGLIKGGTIGSGSTAFGVPAGFQPEPTTYADRHFTVVTNPYVLGIVQANASSRTFEIVNGSNVWIDLSMIHYFVAP